MTEKKIRRIFTDTEIELLLGAIDITINYWKEDDGVIPHWIIEKSYKDLKNKVAGKDYEKRP